MKLHSLSTRYYLLASIAILGATGILLFYMLRLVFNQEIDEQLTNQAEIIFQGLEKDQMNVKGTNLAITLLEGSVPSLEAHADTMIYTSADGEMEPFRLLTIQRNINGQAYRVQTWVSRLEWNDFFAVIFWIFILIALLLVGAQWLINHLVQRKLWRPFFYNLDLLSNYSVRQSSLPDFKGSTIDEFETFRTTAVKASQKARDEFLAVKQFTENAAHEIQTPLAIIRNKIEQLIQSENLSHEDLLRLGEALEASDRLTRLNKSLILLTKLENDQFDIAQYLNISHILKLMVDEVADELSIKKIRFNTEITDPVYIQGNTTLLEILLTNLLQNMLRFTPDKGEAFIRLTQTELLFSNAGGTAPLDASRVFSRFYKENSLKSRTGLGLAIVREICQVLHWEINYRFELGNHQFIINFPSL